MAEMEMDLNVPLLETGLPEQMPMRFRKLLDPNIPIPDEICFEAQLLLQQFELRLLLISLLNFVLGLPLLLIGIAGVLDRIAISLSISGLIVLLGLAVLFVGAGFFLSSTGAKKLRKEQESGMVRLGNFYCKDALLQNLGNSVNLVPKNLFVRLESHTSRAHNDALTHPGSLFLVYKGKFDKVCRLKLRDAKINDDALTMTIEDLQQWAGCELREI